MSVLPDVPPLDNPGLYQFLLAVRTNVRDLVAGAAAAATGSAERQPPSFTLDFGGVGDGASANDHQFQTAEADARSTIRIPDGVFFTNLAKTALTKRYVGSGVILAAGAALPAHFSYMAEMPDRWPVAGETGWFRGDQRFTDGGEWKVLGPDVRTYDVTGRYFESTCIPHHAWLDVESGSSGAQGYLTAGAAAGVSSVAIHTTGEAAWVGKQVNICNSFGGAAVETLTVQSVVGSTITFTSPLANTYTWNPAAGLTPCLQFAPRTWTGHKYIRVRHRGGGDGYGHIVRMQVEYQPKASELIHAFNACTGGQYGGDVNFLTGTSGTMATGWESQYDDQGNDVAVYAQIDSFARRNDKADGGGRVWIGTKFASSVRPCDVAHAVSGKWRYALDTAKASLVESTVLTAEGAIGAATITVKSTNGARVNDDITINHPTNPATVYTGVITSVGAGTIGISPNLAAVFPVDSYVELLEAGGIVNAALGQKIIWNSTSADSGRGGDSLGIWPPLWGNVHGDIETGTTSDGSGDFWFTRFNGNGHAGANAYIRLRTNSFVTNVAILGGATIEATTELVTNGLTGNSDMTGAVVFGSGDGNQIRYNDTLARFEIVKNNVVIQTFP